MTELESLRDQLKYTQKLASLGMLSAGIAHEIQNPLNFVINFSKMSEKLISDIKDIVEDIKDDISEDDAADLLDITEDLNLNMQKIHEHGDHLIIGDILGIEFRGMIKGILGASGLTGGLCGTADGAENGVVFNGSVAFHTILHNFFSLFYRL